MLQFVTFMMDSCAAYYFSFNKFEYFHDPKRGTTAAVTKFLLKCTQLGVVPVSKCFALFLCQTDFRTDIDGTTNACDSSKNHFLAFTVGNELCDDL